MALLNVSWTNVVRATASTNNLTKTGSDGWDGGGRSTEQAEASVDCYVTFQNGNTKTMMCGLSDSDPDQNYTSIKQCWYAHANGNSYIYESGTFRGQFGSYTAGSTVLKVSKEGSAVKYYKDGSLIYTSGNAAPGYPIFVDCSLYDLNGQLANVQFEDGAASGQPAIVRSQGIPYGGNHSHRFGG